MRPTTRPVANATSPSRGEEVRLLEIREVLPGRHLHFLQCPVPLTAMQLGQAQSTQFQGCRRHLRQMPQSGVEPLEAVTDTGQLVHERLPVITRCDPGHSYLPRRFTPVTDLPESSSGGGSVNLPINCLMQPAGDHSGTPTRRR